MSRQYFRQPDIFPTISVLVSAPDTLAGQTWRGVLPLSGMTFDHRTTQTAFISAVIAAAFGGDTLPDGVRCKLLADTSAADYASGFNPRQTPLGAISFELSFASDFAGMSDVPLIFTVAGIATDAPANDDLTLPTIATNSTDITLKDYQGGTLPGGFYSEVVPEVSDGKSAYEIAVEEGFVGDETAWLASLKGEPGEQGPAGTSGSDGADGQGVPAGGTAGQVLAKNSGTDYDTEWVDPPEGGGGGSVTPTQRVNVPLRNWILGQDWTLRGSVGEEINIYSVKWAEKIGIFCAVGSGGINYTSPDGITWTQRSGAISGNLLSLEWADDIKVFCATDSSHGIQSSQDGITWTQRTNPASTKNIRSVTWSSKLSLFCGVGEDGTIITSPDGATWTARTSGTANHLTSVTWAAGLDVFCAVGYSSTVLTSTDGITWSSQTNSGGSLNSIVWSPGLNLFYAGKYAAAGSIYSSDGVTWSSSTFDGTLQCPIWIPELGCFIAIANNYPVLEIAFSVGGDDWEYESKAGLLNTNAFAWSAQTGLLCSVGSGEGNKIRTSVSAYSYPFISPV